MLGTVHVSSVESECKGKPNPARVSAVTENNVQEQEQLNVNEMIPTSACKWQIMITMCWSSKVRGASSQQSSKNIQVGILLNESHLFPADLLCARLV